MEPLGDLRDRYNTLFRQLQPMELGLKELERQIFDITEH